MNDRIARFALTIGALLLLTTGPLMAEPDPSGAAKRDGASVTIAEPIAEDFHESTHYRFSTTKWSLPFIKDSGVSGPFGILGPDRFLFVSRCGMVSLVGKEGSTFKLFGQKPVPFVSDIYCEGGPEKKLAGVKDMLISADRTSAKGNQRIYLSYTSETAPGCLVLKVVRFDLTPDPDLRMTAKANLYVSAPCGPTPVTFTQVSGVLAENASHVYFGVGDFGHGRNRQARSEFASIFRWSKKSKRASAKQFAIGVRNPEGLTFVPANKRNPKKRVLFSTDMGPKAGDEINIINKGDDLGYSDSSYGIGYGHDIDSDNRDSFDQHDIGKKPEYVFVPAVAPTAIAYYDQEMFKNWNQSLIMATLRAGTLFRIRLDGTRVVYAEPIAVTKERMRFVHIADDGSIYVKADPDILIRVHRAPQAATQGTIDAEKLVANKGCQSCHLPSGRGNGVPLVGRDPIRITNALNNFASGERASEVMGGIARSLSMKERQSVAQFLSAPPIKTK